MENDIPKKMIGEFADKFPESGSFVFFFLRLLLLSLAQNDGSDEQCGLAQAKLELQYEASNAFGREQSSGEGEGIGCREIRFVQMAKGFQMMMMNVIKQALGLD